MVWKVYPSHEESGVTSKPWRPHSINMGSLRSYHVKVYGDDKIITGTDAEEIEHLQQRLSTKIDSKFLGTFRYFLRIVVP